jgi:hypothetical protein
VRNKEIQIGQIWRSEETGDSWLVTKIYSEAFTSYAVLRKVEGRESDLRRVRVERSDDGAVLSGFRLVEESP